MDAIDVSVTICSRHLAVTKPTVPFVLTYSSPSSTLLHNVHQTSKVGYYIDQCHCHCQSVIQMVTPYGIKLALVQKIEFVLTKFNRNCYHQSCTF